MIYDDMHGYCMHYIQMIYNILCIFILCILYSYAVIISYRTRMHTVSYGRMYETL